jgi:hypothetical protein
MSIDVEVSTVGGTEHPRLLATAAPLSDPLHLAVHQSRTIP